MNVKTRAFEAMEFAKEVHKDQRRKYTGNPYFDHLAEVAGIAMSVGWHYAEIHPDKFMSVCWLHDCIEDQGVTLFTLKEMFGLDVALGVACLSNMNEGNRKIRMAAYKDQIVLSPSWVQTIKCADIISNTPGILEHDPKFAEVYVSECKSLVLAMNKANCHLRDLALRGLEP